MRKALAIAIPAAVIVALALLLSFLFPPPSRGQIQGFYGPQIPATNVLADTNLAATTSAPVTNVTPSFVVGSVNLPTIASHIYDGGFGPNATNTSVTVNEQLSFDNVNFFTVAYWQPPLTNPTYALFASNLQNETIYCRFTYNVTNNGPLGIHIP